MPRTYAKPLYIPPITRGIPYFRRLFYVPGGPDGREGFALIVFTVHVGTAVTTVVLQVPDGTLLCY